MTDDQELVALGRRLAAVAPEVDWPATPALRSAVLGRLRASAPAVAQGGLQRWARPRRIAIAVAAALALVGASLALPPWREALAGVFGLRGVTVQHGTPPAPAPRPVRSPSSTARPSGPGAGLELGDPVAVAAIGQAGLGFTPLLPSALGTPDAAWIGAVRGSAVRVLTLVYLPGPGRPPADPATHLAALVTEFDGTLAPEFIGKYLGAGARADQVTVGPDAGLWITGAPHDIAFRDSAGEVQADTLRLAGTTLLWNRGPLLVRVEGAPTLEAAQAIAASMR